MDFSDLKVVPAKAEHLPAIAELAGVVWRASYLGIISPEQIEYMLGWMYDLSQLEQDLASGISFDRLIVDGELVGFSSYGPLAGEMKLHKLYIHPQWQRRGFGTKLLQHAEEIARNRGFSKMILGVNKTNQRAIDSYKKSGFVIRASMVTDIGGGFAMDDYEMEKAL